RKDALARLPGERAERGRERLLLPAVVGARRDEELHAIDRRRRLLGARGGGVRARFRGRLRRPFGALGGRLRLPLHPGLAPRAIVLPAHLFLLAVDLLHLMALEQLLAGRARLRLLHAVVGEEVLERVGEQRPAVVAIREID